MIKQEDLDAWEQEMVDKYDLSDLADCVQMLRVLGWSTPGMKVEGAMIWYENLHEFGPVIAQLDAIEGEDATAAAALARLYRRVHAALMNDPRRPSEEDVVRRYVRGEIGDRTARYVLGIDAWGLISVCRKYGLPPIQIGDSE